MKQGLGASGKAQQFRRTTCTPTVQRSWATADLPQLTQVQTHTLTIPPSTVTPPIAATPPSPPVLVKDIISALKNEPIPRAQFKKVCTAIAAFRAKYTEYALSADVILQRARGLQLIHKHIPGFIWWKAVLRRPKVITVQPSTLLQNLQYLMEQSHIQFSYSIDWPTLATDDAHLIMIRSPSLLARILTINHLYIELFDQEIPPQFFKFGSTRVLLMSFDTFNKRTHNLINFVGHQRAFKILKSHPRVLIYTPQHMDKIKSSIQQSLPSLDTANVLSRAPSLLEYSPSTLSIKITALMRVVSQDHEYVSTMVNNSPQLLTMSTQLLRQRYQYLQDVVSGYDAWEAQVQGVSPQQLATCLTSSQTVLCRLLYKREQQEQLPSLLPRHVEARTSSSQPTTSNAPEEQAHPPASTQSTTSHAACVTSLAPAPPSTSSAPQTTAAEAVDTTKFTQPPLPTKRRKRRALKSLFQLLRRTRADFTEREPQFGEWYSQHRVDIEKQWNILGSTMCFAVYVAGLLCVVDCATQGNVLFAHMLQVLSGTVSVVGGQVL